MTTRSKESEDNAAGPEAEGIRNVDPTPEQQPLVLGRRPKLHLPDEGRSRAVRARGKIATAFTESGGVPALVPPFEGPPLGNVQWGQLTLGHNGNTAPDGHPPVANANPAAGTLESFIWASHFEGYGWARSAIKVRVPDDVIANMNADTTLRHLKAQAVVDRAREAWASVNTLSGERTYVDVWGATTIYLELMPDLDPDHRQFPPAAGIPGVGQGDWRQVLPKDDGTENDDTDPSEGVVIENVWQFRNVRGEPATVVSGGMPVYVLVVAMAYPFAGWLAGHGNHDGYRLMDHCSAAGMISAQIREVRIWPTT
jgi:hypothetical protein